MSYHIYTTKGIVLSERPWRESDRIYDILTRDLGLIRTTTLGVRKVESKLRGALEPFCFTSVSLVRGKEFWRTTSAQYLGPIPNSHSIARPLSLLQQLVQGEVPHPELFDTVEQELVQHRTDDEMFEIRLVSRILHKLGYLKESDLTLDKSSLVKAINEGLHVSHLT